jgi:NAD(P)-dependent dehydrogenase (short-subunit alcohol dehydrogenase family)
MSGRLNGKVAIITGAGAGIGEAIAHLHRSTELCGALCANVGGLSCRSAIAADAGGQLRTTKTVKSM